MERGGVIRKAKAQSALATARVQGMKIAAAIDPPRAAVGGFPYPARTCAEWGQVSDSRRKYDRDLTPIERIHDAANGSAMLRDAILRLAA